MALPLRPPPHPLELNGGRNFFLLKSSKKVIVFFNAPPPYLMTRPLKRTFFAASLIKCQLFAQE